MNIDEEFDARLRRVLGFTDDSFPVRIEVTVLHHETFRSKTFKSSKQLLDAMEEVEL